MVAYPPLAVGRAWESSNEDQPCCQTLPGNAHYQTRPPATWPGQVTTAVAHAEVQRNSDGPCGNQTLCKPPNEAISGSMYHRVVTRCTSGAPAALTGL